MSDLTTDRQAYRIVQEVLIDRPRERVFRALTDPSEIPEWWSVPGGTRLVLEHTAFKRETARDDHVRGWPPVLENLRKHVRHHG